MKIPVQLKNIGGNIPENDIALQVSYFIKSQNDELLPQSDAYIAPASGKIDVSFGNNLARNKDVFFAVALKSNNILAQTSTSATQLKDEVSITMEFDYSPLVLSEPDDQIVSPRPLFVYGRLLDKQGKKKLEDVQIIFEATRANDGGLQPIASVRTEADGYFLLSIRKVVLLMPVPEWVCLFVKIQSLSGLMKLGLMATFRIRYFLAMLF